MPNTELPITGFDAIELFVGNARQANVFFQMLFGFQCVGYRGAETGAPGGCSYYLKQGNMELILSSSLDPHSEISQHVAKHGDGIKDVAFTCTDVELAFNTAVQRGAKPVKAPYKLEDEHGFIELAMIATYGETTHTFVDRSHYKGLFSPYYKKPVFDALDQTECGLTHIDHIVGNVPKGEMNQWVEFYEEVFGFHVIKYFSKDDIHTEQSSLASKVVANRNYSIRMPINEPEEGKGKSQIEEYIDYYQSAGVQHVAIATQDIVKTIAQLKQNGVPFIYVPQGYYDDIKPHVGQVKEDWSDLARLGILVDRESKGYLLQLFTQPLQDRPTLFFEIIQRQEGASGFGHGNFQALFEAIEREQQLRGNL